MKATRAENLPRPHGHVQAKDNSASTAQRLPDPNPADKLITASVIPAPTASPHTAQATSAVVAARSGPTSDNKTPPPGTVQVYEPFQRSGDTDFLGGSMVGMAHERHTWLSKEGEAAVVTSARLLQLEFKDARPTVEMAWRHMSTNPWDGHQPSTGARRL